MSERRIRAEVLRALGELFVDEYRRSQFKRFEFGPADMAAADALLRDLAANLLAEYRKPCTARLTEAGYRLLKDEIGALLAGGEPPPAGAPASEPPTEAQLGALSRDVGGADYFTESRIIDGHVVTVWATPGFQRVTGYTAEEFVAAGGWAAVIPDAQGLAGLLARLAAGEKIIGEMEIIARDRHRRNIRFVALPRMDGDRLVGTYGAGKDITPAR